MVFSPDPDESAGLRCALCGYDLRGLPGDICPECGREFDRSPRAAAAPDRSFQVSVAAGCAIALSAAAILASLHDGLEIVELRGWSRFCCGRCSVHGEMLMLGAPILIGMSGLACVFARFHPLAARISGCAAISGLAGWVTVLLLLTI